MELSLQEICREYTSESYDAAACVQCSGHSLIARTSLNVANIGLRLQGGAVQQPSFRPGGFVEGSEEIPSQSRSTKACRRDPCREFRRRSERELEESDPSMLCLRALHVRQFRV